jgi:hypothetical protein
MLNLSIPVGGLTIKGKSLYSPQASGLKGVIAHSTLRISNGSIGAAVTQAATEKAKTNNLSLSFTESLLKALNEAAKRNEEEKKRTDEERAELARAVAEAADEARKSFGYSESNRFMAQVLSATEGGVTEERLSGAVADFVRSVKSRALEAMRDPSTRNPESESCDKVLGKLSDFVSYLNDGAEGSDKLSLSAQINKHYGRAALAEEEQKKFTEDGAWVSDKELREEEEARNKAAALSAFVITKDEVGAEVVSEAVSFLSDTVSSQKAASILSDLKAGEDIFDAVDKVRSVLAEEDRAEAEAAQTESEAASAGGPALPTAETAALSGSDAAKVLGEAVKSAQKSALFDKFLENYFLTEINKTIQTNAETEKRLSASVSFSTGITCSFGTIGLKSWPGLLGSRSSGLSVSIGFEREFVISSGEDGKIEAKFTQSVKIEASFNTRKAASPAPGLAAAATLAQAKALEASYTLGKVNSGNSGTASAIKSGWLLSSVI